MFESMRRGHIHAKYSVKKLYNEMATRIQMFWKAWSAQMRWRGIARKIMTNGTATKDQSHESGFANSRMNVERERVRQHKAANKLSRYYKRHLNEVKRRRA